MQTFAIQDRPRHQVVPARPPVRPSPPRLGSMFHFGPYHSLRRLCLCVCGCDSTQVASKSSWTGTKWTRRTVRTPQPRLEIPPQPSPPASSPAQHWEAGGPAVQVTRVDRGRGPHLHPTTRQAASGPHLETAISNTNNHQRKRLAAFLALTKQPSNTRRCVQVD